MTTNGQSHPIGSRKTKVMSKAIARVNPQPTEILPTFRMAYENQIQVLRAYPSICGALLRPVTNSEIASLVALAADTVSYTNAFFTAIGLLKRGENGNEPCQELMTYYNAYQWEPETAFHKLAPIFQRAWFSNALLPKLRFKDLTDDEAVAELAAACCAGPKYRLQLRLILKYLEEAGIIQRENGVIKLAKIGSQATFSPTDSVEMGADEHGDAGKSEASRRALSVDDRSGNRISTAFEKQKRGAIQLSIDINVDMSEMSKWSPERITAFLSGLAQVLSAKGEIERKEGSH